MVELEWVKWRKMGVLSKSLPKWCFGFGLGEMSRKCRFYKEFVDITDVPFLASGDLLQNVNHAPSLGEKIL